MPDDTGSRFKSPPSRPVQGCALSRDRGLIPSMDLPTPSANPEGVFVSGRCRRDLRTDAYRAIIGRFDFDDATGSSSHRIQEFPVSNKNATLTAADRSVSLPLVEGSQGPS